LRFGDGVEVSAMSAVSPSERTFPTATVGKPVERTEIVPVIRTPARLRADVVDVPPEIGFFTVVAEAKHIAELVEPIFRSRRVYPWSCLENEKKLPIPGIVSKTPVIAWLWPWRRCRFRRSSQEQWSERRRVSERRPRGS
jgi:hypothetical protein